MRFTIRRRMLIGIRPELRGKPSPQARHINVAGHDVVEVTFTREQAMKVIELARKQVKLRMPVFGPKDFYKIVKTTQCGFLGQVAFYIWAYDEFEEGLNSITIGRPDGGDFTLEGYKGDVKCNGRRDANAMLMPEYRFQRSHFDLYVGARTMNEEPYVVQIWGYATRKEVEKNGYIDDFGYGDTRCYPLNLLHPIIMLKSLQ